MPGDWMSVSITPTRLPPAASRAARLAVVLDLPVPPRKEWIVISAAIARARARCGGPRGLWAGAGAPRRTGRGLTVTARPGGCQAADVPRRPEPAHLPLRRPSS